MIIQKETISVLLVGGFGHAVFVFDEWLRDDANVHLVGAVQTLEDESLQGFLSHPWCKNVDVPLYKDLNEALIAEKPDLVIVSTRPDLNPKLIVQSLQAGCHVIAEKPLAVDEDGLQQIYHAVVETGKYVLPMLGTYDCKAFVKARELIHSGLIGEIALVNSRKSYQWGNRANWFKQRELYGGIWSWVGIHSFSMAELVLQKNVKKIVAAQEFNRFHGEFGTGCSDTLSGLFLLDDDIQMTVSVDLLRPDVQESWGDDWLRIVGSKGILEARPRLDEVTVITRSSLYSSPPMGPQDQPDYINAVVEIDTTLFAHNLLDALQGIEQQQGRVRDRHWGERTIDLDLLVYGNNILDDERLNVPHPGIAERSFVLYPLAEIVSDLNVPTLGDIEQLLKNCPRDGLERME